MKTSRSQAEVQLFLWYIERGASFYKDLSLKMHPPGDYDLTTIDFHILLVYALL